MSEKPISAWVCVVACILKKEKYFHSNLLEAQNAFFFLCRVFVADVVTPFQWRFLAAVTEP